MSERQRELPPEWKAILEASQEIENEFRAEREKNRKLALELTRLKLQKDALERKLEILAESVAAFRPPSEPARTPVRIQVEDPRLQESLHVLTHERDAIRELEASLKREIAQLKRLTPLRGILAAKQLEIDRIRKALKRLPEGHAERASIERIYQDHLIERDGLEELLLGMERKLDQRFGELASERDSGLGDDLDAALDTHVRGS